MPLKEGKGGKGGRRARESAERRRQGGARQGGGTRERGRPGVVVAKKGVSDKGARASLSLTCSSFVLCCRRRAEGRTHRRPPPAFTLPLKTRPRTPPVCFWVADLAKGGDALVFERLHAITPTDRSRSQTGSGARTRRRPARKKIRQLASFIPSSSSSSGERGGAFSQRRCCRGERRRNDGDGREEGCGAFFSRVGRRKTDRPKPRENEQGGLR